MLGEFSPTSKNLLPKANTWTQNQTYRAARAAQSSSTNQDSPAHIWEGSAWNTNSSTAAYVAFKAFTRATPAGPGYGQWKLQYSLNRSAYSDALTWSANGIAGTKPLFTAHAYTVISTDNSSTIDTLQSLNVTSSGNQNHIVMSFGSTIRAGWSTDSNGNTSFKSAGSSPQHNFFVGGSITSQAQIMQIYSGGVYNTAGNFTVGVVTAGSGDTSAQTTLSSYGSFAVKGVLVTSSSYTLAQTETMVYCDPSNASFCTGTPAAACSSYSTETPCNAHSAVGCSWFAGNSCGNFNGDQGSCTGTSGCTWDQVSCSGQNNTDQSSCESQDDTYGGTCSWDTSTCPGQSDEGACNGVSGCSWSTTCSSSPDEFTCTGNGCTWNFSSCSDFTDEPSCVGQSPCSWDGSSCSGQYNTSCTGDSCSGNLCTGTYANGNCSGTYGVGCQGTAACSNISSSSPCAAETGCTWTVGITVKLPLSSNSLRSTTGRIYSIVHVGSTGTCAIQGQTNENIFQFGNMTLFKKGDKVLLHNQNITYPCSSFSTQTPCQAQAGCTWNPVVVCTSFNGDQSGCESSGVCTWNSGDSTCSGDGRSTANCSGNFSTLDRWYAHSLERGLNYVEKTSTYTLTDIDDVVNCTSGTFTLNLPSAALNNGKQFILKNTGAGTITVDPSGSQTIDGLSTDTIASGGSMTIVSNNNNWIKI